ncbi:MAG: MBL fold metallo-hydrolase [Candidatus Marinimicrobia bacterium]|nr:MBL fold metallo-hydrolase [Candidatus Neomarinimicrobiota bacterium]
MDLVSTLIVLLGFCAATYSQDQPIWSKTLKKMHWYGQAGWRIEKDSLNIYIDPLQIPDQAPAADVIFVTHSHSDHLSIRDIKALAGDHTLLVGPESCREKLLETGLKTIQWVNPGDTLVIRDIPVEVVPAYNIKKNQFHPKENRWVGYILNINGVKIYHSGDTERIPEMQTFHCDIALLPLGQTYTMHNIEEAVQAALDINPKIAVPMHYGMYEGKAEDADRFKKLLEGKIEVIIQAKE